MTASYPTLAASPSTIRSFPRAVFGIAVLSFLAKCAMALLTYGTNDVTTWHLDVVKAWTEGAGALYRDGVQSGTNPVQVFSHPPAMINVLYLWQLLVGLTGLPLQFWMRFSCAVADAVSLALLWKLGQRMPSLQITDTALMLVAACPISIMVSGFHGNTDPIMIMFVVAAVYFVEAEAPIIAGLFFGLALCIKIVPVIFGIAFLLYLSSLKSRLRFVAASAAVFIGAGLPHFATDPLVIVRGLAGYHGQPGVAVVALNAIGIGPTAHRILFLTAVVAMSIVMNLSRRIPLFVQIGGLTFLFLALAPGSAVQYLAWGVPWVVWLGSAVTAAYYLIPGEFVAHMYTRWSGGFPWYMGDSDAVRLETAGSLSILACWLTCCAIFLGCAMLMPGRAANADQ